MLSMVLGELKRDSIDSDLVKNLKVEMAALVAIFIFGSEPIEVFDIKKLLIFL